MNEKYSFPRTVHLRAMRRTGLLAFVASVLIVTVKAEETSKMLFGIPLQPKEAMRVEAFKDLIPVSVFSIRKEMKAPEVVRTLRDFQIETTRTPSFASWLKCVTPEGNHFEHLDVLWEAGRISSLKLSACRLPPARGRLLRLVTELERLLGKPIGAFRQMDYGRAIPLSLILEWKHGSDVLRLSLMREGEIFEMELCYYPGPDNPVLPRIDRVKREPVVFETLGTLIQGFIEEIQFLPAGDGMRQPINLPEGEREMLAAYSRLSIKAKNKNRDWKETWQPFQQRLDEALRNHYSKLTKAAMYERLVLIAEGKVAGFSSGEIQVGAAGFLAGHDDPKVIDYLIRGLDVELPSGVGICCADGIGRQCSGKLMDRVLKMFDAPETRSNAASILLSLTTRSQLEELKTKAKKSNPEAREGINAVISMLLRRESME